MKREKKATLSELTEAGKKIREIFRTGGDQRRIDEVLHSLPSASRMNFLEKVVGPTEREFLEKQLEEKRKRAA